MDSSYNMNIYRKSEGAAKSLYFQDEEELRILRDGVRGEMVSLGLSLFMGLLLFFITRGFFGTEVFYSSTPLVGFFAIHMLILLGFAGLVDYGIFQSKNKEVVKKKDLTFTNIIYSKIFHIGRVLRLFFTILMPLSLVFSMIPNLGFKKGALLLLLPLLPLVFDWIFRKKIKTSNLRTRTKKTIFFALLFVLPCFMIFFTISNMETGENQKITVEEGDSYDVERLDRSFLTKSHELITSENLIVEKTLLKNRQLAEVFSKDL